MASIAEANTLFEIDMELDGLLDNFALHAVRKSIALAALCA